ncbi:thiol protease [Thermococcus sp. 4557]|uniref:C1 family peptidase n=1 Tax=Thermococcus sp. (strain CGMCC 1.5172 / 4557) TaxID=1042877 RepID=UPI000219E88B|nr:C1 family peptidase [Thermococcus sp. 4557]AEK73778.1 thiol protease [Thermococcus sp. 4557]
MKFGKLLAVFVLITVLAGIFGSYAAAADMPYKTGAILISPEEYSKLTGFKFVPVTEEVYNHLIKIAPSYPRNPPISKDTLMAVAAPGPVPPGSLPSSVNNSLYLPPIGNQGNVGSCNAWASTYYVWTYMINWFRSNPHPSTGDVIMNPSFTYNLINAGYNSGSIGQDAMALISTIGAVAWDDFPVNTNDPNNVDDWPVEWQWKKAMLNRGIADMYNAIWKGSSTTGIIYIIDMTDSTQFQYLKGLLAAGYIAYTGINVYKEFYYFDSTNNVYALNQPHTLPEGHNTPGGHAITIVGYDDNKKTPDGNGALLFVNSWGTGWGDHGYGWLTYQAAQDSNHLLSHGYAYILVPKEPQPYQPKIYASLKITHPKRGEVIGGLFKQDCPEGYVCFPPKVNGGIELGVNISGYTVWNSRFLDFWIGYQHYPYDGLADYQAHPFPDSPIVFDLTDSLDTLTTSSAVNSQYVPFYIKLADKYGDGVTGTLDSFEVIVNSTYMHRIIEASTDFPVSIPENGNWLTVSANVPIVDYFGNTPLDKQELNTNWAYIEVGSIVNMSSAVLHFNGQDYTMDMDNTYHFYYNVSGLDDGTYTYSVTVTLQNGNSINLPQRTVYISTSSLNQQVIADSAQWADDSTIAPGETGYVDGTFVWKDVVDNGVSPFTGRTYDLTSLQLRYDSANGLLYLKIGVTPMDNLGTTPASLLKVYFDVDSDGSWDYTAVVDLAKAGARDGVASILDLYNTDGAQITTRDAVFVPSTTSSSVFLQMPADLISLSSDASLKVKVELYEHDEVYGPLDVLGTSTGSDSADVDLQQVPVFSNIEYMAVLVLLGVLLFRRK